MAVTVRDSDPEIKAMEQCFRWLDPLDGDAQKRVLTWLHDLIYRQHHEPQFAICEFLKDGRRREIYPGLTWSGQSATDNLGRLRQQYPRQRIELILKTEGNRGDALTDEETKPC